MTEDNGWKCTQWTREIYLFWIMSLPSGWGDILCLFSRYSVHPYGSYGCLFVTKSCPLYKLKPFKALLWHLIQTQSIIRWMTCKSKDSYFSFIHFWIYVFSALWIAFSCHNILYNLKTLQDSFMKLSIIIRSHTKLSISLYVFFLIMICSSKTIIIEW